MADEEESDYQDQAREMALSHSVAAVQLFVNAMKDEHNHVSERMKAATRILEVAGVLSYIPE